MSIRSQGRALEKNYIRPILKKIKSAISPSKPSGSTSGSREPRIEELEKRIDELERLVREDLGLRYLGLVHEDVSKPRSN